MNLKNLKRVGVPSSMVEGPMVGSFGGFANSPKNFKLLMEIVLDPEKKNTKCLSFSGVSNFNWKFFSHFTN
jgi:hypothetical protein